MRTNPVFPVIVALMSVFLPACHKHEKEHGHEQQKIIVTTPLRKDVVLTQQYVCQIHSQRHIKVRALQGGYLESIPFQEGQRVTKDQVLSKIVPILYKTKLDAELAEAKLAELELNNTKRLHEQKVVSIQEVALYEAKLARAQAKAEQARAEMNFTIVKAPFDGIIDRQDEQHGSLVKEGDVLTVLSDNNLMWVYFNVPESRYLEFMADVNAGQAMIHKRDDEDDDDDDQPKNKVQGPPITEKARQDIELVLANGKKFKEPGKIGAIGTNFNNENGNVSFRADFPNPDHLLRHGMTGNILIHKMVKNALVIPQRATFEILDKQYVFVVDQENKVHQREIKVQHEMENIYVIKSGLKPDDRIVYEGTRLVHDGEKVEYEFQAPAHIMAHQNHHAE